NRRARRRGTDSIRSAPGGYAGSGPLSWRGRGVRRGTPGRPSGPASARPRPTRRRSRSGRGPRSRAAGAVARPRRSRRARRQRGGRPHVATIAGRMTGTVIIPIILQLLVPLAILGWLAAAPHATRLSWGLTLVLAAAWIGAVSIA